MAWNDHQQMASNFSFGLDACSEANGILILLAQTIVALPLYSILLGKRGHISSLKHWNALHHLSFVCAIDAAKTCLS